MLGEFDQPVPPPAGDDLLILFARDARPTVRQVQEMCAASDFVDVGGPDLHDYPHPVDIAPPNGVGLQRSGLTFDFVGLAPGPAVPVPDLPHIAQLPDDMGFLGAHATSLRLGPHIEAGRRSQAILREWFALAADILAELGGQGICWVPAEGVYSLHALSTNLAGWDALGDTPVQMLGKFRRTLDGAVQSQGLSFFTGQEFRIEPSMVRDDDDGLARLIFSHLFYAGTLLETAQLVAPDGHALRLKPSENGRYVRVWPG